MENESTPTTRYMQLAEIAGQLDTGASRGHCPHQWLLHDYCKYSAPKRETFDAGQCKHQSHGEGNLCLQTMMPGIIKAINIKYTPTISGTLLSVGAHTKSNKHHFYGYNIDANNDTG